MESMESEQEIRQIAYQLWVAEGRPEGRDLEHWLKAQAIWQESLRKKVTSEKHAQPAETPPKAKPKRAGTRARQSTRKTK